MPKTKKSPQTAKTPTSQRAAKRAKMPAKQPKNPTDMNLLKAECNKATKGFLMSRLLNKGLITPQEAQAATFSAALELDSSMKIYHRKSRLAMIEYWDENEEQITRTYEPTLAIYAAKFAAMDKICDLCNERMLSSDLFRLKLMDIRSEEMYLQVSEAEDIALMLKLPEKQG